MRVKKPNSIKNYKVIPTVLFSATLAGFGGYAIGNQNGYKEGYAGGYTEGDDTGFNEKDEYKYYNVKDGMNYGIQRQYDKERSYFLNLSENESKLYGQEYKERSHRLIQSIKMLFRNKAEIFAQNEDEENDRLEFREEGIYIRGENGYKVFEFGPEHKQSALHRFTSRMIQLQNAADNNDLNGIQEALGGEKMDAIMRFLSTCEILNLSDGSIVITSDPNFDKIESNEAKRLEDESQAILLHPTIQAYHKPYEASNLISKANKAAKAIQNVKKGSQER